MRGSAAIAGRWKIVRIVAQKRTQLQRLEMGTEASCAFLHHQVKVFTVVRHALAAAGYGQNPRTADSQEDGERHDNEKQGACHDAQHTPDQTHAY